MTNINTFYESDYPKRYTFNLLTDYEAYIKEYGFISVNEFIASWNCILLKDFDNLQPGDEVYDYSGNKIVITDFPYIADNEVDHYIEAADGDIYEAGDLYRKNYISNLMDYKKKICKGEKAICPILITKTKQPQN